MNRYQRQINLPQIGEAGQQKLAQSRVLVIGAGGLGCAILPYLASTGIRYISIYDGDTVAESNLHRQLLYSENDIGKEKVYAATDRLIVQFPSIYFDIHPTFFTEKNGDKIAGKYDLIIDATDNIEARYVIDRASKKAQIPFVHAALMRFQIQVSVFNYKDGPSYADLYPQGAVASMSCEEAGIMPGTVALAAMYQYHEVIKILLDMQNVLSGKLLLIDTLKNQHEIFNFTSQNQSSIAPQKETSKPIAQAIDYTEARKMDSLIVDVRGRDEWPMLTNRTIKNVPLQRLLDSLKEADREMPIALFCQSGSRSKYGAQQLIEAGFKKVFYLNENAPELFQLENGNAAGVA